MSNLQVPRRRWGKTELSIPVIPFGTQGFGNNFGPVTDEEAADLIRYAVDIGVNHFDVLFIHDPKNIEPTLASGGTLEGLEKARERGWVNFIGYGMRPHDFHLAHIESGRTDAFLCFGDHNLLRQTARDRVLPAAAEHDLGVMNGWSIMRGYLTGVPVENFVHRDRWKEDHERAETMRLWCEEHGHNLLELTLQFTIRETRIHGNPLGSLNKEQLEANVRAACATVSDDVFESFFAANF